LFLVSFQPALVVNSRPASTNLHQNGFAHAMGADIPAWQGNAITYQEHLTQDKDKIIGSLKCDWLGRGWRFVAGSIAFR